MALRMMLACVPLLVVLCMAAALDIRTRKIPNWLTLGLALGGIVAALFGCGAVSFWQALAGLGVGFGVTLVMMLAGAMGGGDVKLMAAVGAWMGPAGVLIIAGVAAMVAVPIVLVHAMRRGQLRALGESTLGVVGHLAARRRLPDLSCEQGAFRSIDRPLPFAVPVLAATALTLLGMWLRR